ncbi:MAG: hypothetical protein ISS25_00395 [Nanoarchaeota archaeon]|nr:hypothetical protein [DPANN group archaeon]MBL7116276.1 hypothetical protein [Nanoarchaeota archaeon]
MNPLLLGTFIISFLVTFIITPVWIRRAKRAKIVGNDMHKLGKKMIPEMGGICVIIGFLSGVFFYVAIQTFFFNVYGTALQIMAIVTTILIITMIGVFDDLLGLQMILQQSIIQDQLPEVLQQINQLL